MTIHDPESEAMVVGAALQDPAVIPELLSIVQPEMFHLEEQHGWIWESICNVWSRGEPVSVTTVAHDLARLGRLDAVGAQSALRELKRRATTVRVDWYARQVRDAYNARRLVSLAHNAAQDIIAEPDKAVERRDRLVNDLLRIGDDSEHERILDERYFDNPVELLEYLDDPQKLQGIQTPWRAMDRIFRGWQGGKLYVVQAPTSIGKSLFVQQVAEHASTHGHPVLLFTSEMSNKQVLAFRIAWMHAEVDPQAGVRRGYFDNDERTRVLEAIEDLRSAPLTVSENVSLSSILGHIQRLVSAGGCSLVIIDHLQHVQTGDTTARERIESAMRAMKEASVRYDLPMLIVSHVNRQALREPIRNASGMHSATIEQDANVVIKLSVEQFDGAEVPDIETFRENHGYTPIRCDIEKHREGRTGVIRMRQDWRKGGKYFEVTTHG